MLSSTSANSSPASRQTQSCSFRTKHFSRIRRTNNLHWHDLRREYASRLVEKGVPLAQVRDLLGHASILTTERYDNQKLKALQAAVERLEEGKKFDAADVPDKVSSFFQVSAVQHFADSADAARQIPGNN